MKILFSRISAKITYHAIASVAGLAIGFILMLTTTPSRANNLEVIDGEYKLPAAIDASVTSKTKTELWAHVWRPKTGGHYPLVVFLHGNHGTCGKRIPELGVRDDDNIDYTTRGKCPVGYVVTPNHMGYAYLARALAKYGFVVVSINANRGINGANPEREDGGLNLRRGRLVLRHLQELAKWNNQDKAPTSLGFQLKGLIDFTQVGLMGHSRGGEGMRAAVAQFNDPDSPWPNLIKKLKFRSLFEIGPVDGQTNRVLNPKGLIWNVLLPACDGDVSDLQGVKPFDRMLLDTTEKRFLNKSTFQVFGANHNFYNTEWQVSDATGCRGQKPLFSYLVGSAAQRRTALHTLIPFFRSNLGANPLPSLAKRFDPNTPLPAALTAETFYARGFTHNSRTAENFIIDNFDRDTGISSHNVANQASDLINYAHQQASPSHDATQRVAAISWNHVNGFLQVNSAATSKGFNASNYQALEFRVSLACFDKLCNSSTDPTGDLDFSISLVDANTTVSEPVALKSYAAVHRPGGSWLSSPAYYTSNELLQTVRIPLSAFANTDLSHFTGVRFTFDRSTKSSIYLANVRLTKAAAEEGISMTLEEANAETEVVAPIAPQRDTSTDENKVIAIRHVRGDGAETSAPTEVEIEIASSRAFPVSGVLPTLLIGKQTFNFAHYPSGDTHHLVFTLAEAEYAATHQGDELTLQIGGAQPWKFGALDKSLAN